MANKFVISDTHFGHTNSWEKFKLADGSPLRPFTSTEEMDETMIERWNAKVKPEDTVYHLGDVVINRKSLHLVSRLNGKKRLVRGNHDIFRDRDYREVGFESLYGVRVFVDKFILSHIPLHPDCVSGRFRVNVHGHLHANRVMRPGMKQWIEKQTKDLGAIEYETDVFRADYSPEPDPRYLCVCVEQTNFEPLSFEEVEERIQQQWLDTGYTPPTNDGWGNGSGPG
jgi:calcineurin-like phosphoesterase family protein